MAVPKRRMSRSNTRNRRAQWKAKLVQLNTVRVNGREITVPRRLVEGLILVRRRAHRRRCAALAVGTDLTRIARHRGWYGLGGTR